MNNGGPLGDEVGVELLSLTHDEIIQQIADQDAAVFIKPDGYGHYQPSAAHPSFPSVDVSGLPWVVERLNAGTVTCGYYGIGDEIGGENVGRFLHLRLNIAPLYVWLTDADEAWFEEAVTTGIWVLFPANENGMRPYIGGPLNPFQSRTVVDPKIGRNDPCPCGSGLKMKRCHGR